MDCLKLVVADIDATLCGRKVGTLGPITKQALIGLHEQEVLLGIASGRPIWEGVEEHFSEWNLGFQFDFLIGMNGSEVMDTHTGETNHYYSLSKESIKEIMELMQPMDCNAFVYRDGYKLYTRYDEEVVNSHNRHHDDYKISDNITDFWSEETAKVLFYTGTTEKRDEVLKYAKHHLTNAYTCFATAPWIVEFQDPRINKGIALAKYCEAKNIDLKDTMTFGDEENDRGLLETAGCGVCLLNGSEEIKKISDAITEYDADHDGVGHYIYSHILNNININKVKNRQ